MSLSNGLILHEHGARRLQKTSKSSHHKCIVYSVCPRFNFGYQCMSSCKFGTFLSISTPSISSHLTSWWLQRFFVAQTLPRSHLLTTLGSLKAVNLRANRVPSKSTYHFYLHHSHFFCSRQYTATPTNAQRPTIYKVPLILPPRSSCPIHHMTVYPAAYIEPPLTTQTSSN